MQSLPYVEGIAAPLPIANLDTDQIMPKQFLRGIDKEGLGQGVLYDLRFGPDGLPRKDFVLNQDAYSGTHVLIGAENFGCGSSREHAVWGLMQYGIQAVIAPSFGEIFYSNAINNRLLVAQVSEANVYRLMEISHKQPGTSIRLDIDSLTIHAADEVFNFQLAPRYRAAFLEGLDMVATTLKSMDEIKLFAEKWVCEHPWLENVGQKVALRKTSQL
ncbi:3-isopropylmalate dehydratase [Pusillimonas sp. T7-7]|uniref:3-isopropylmalate dehydratase small subunit n=1 Tax=Pusillimonas sp. (strain T7-7) TaxID=1007105 RepID=UPI00020856E3|nr:3-isopropylmalate dehydratase small subunit [Pusillimonas sp. T7-7]AEC20856.1 3-isopropylmalate dehydratase [Pusillimonas sp. T7-7]